MRTRRERTVNGELCRSLHESDGVLGVTHVDAGVRQTDSLQLQTSVGFDVNPAHRSVSGDEQYNTIFVYFELTKRSSTRETQYKNVEYNTYI